MLITKEACCDDMVNGLGSAFIGTDNESSLRYGGFERLSEHPVNSKLLASGILV